ncbi:hypothetical protein OAI84_00415 [bacterium]|nr:hypothetical protein [bacterium]
MFFLSDYFFETMLPSPFLPAESGAAAESAAESGAAAESAVAIFFFCLPLYKTEKKVELNCLNQLFLKCQRINPL